MKKHTSQWLTWTLAAGVAAALSVSAFAQAQTSETGAAAGDISAFHVSDSAFAGQLTPQDVAQIVDQRLKEREDQKKQEEEQKKREADAKGYVVGSNLSGVVFFKDGEFLNFSTPNKDFTMHLGGWVQWDNVWWNEPAALQKAQTPKAGNNSIPGVASGAAGGGLNNGTFGGLQDGEYLAPLTPCPGGHVLGNRRVPVQLGFRKQSVQHDRAR